MIKIGKYEIGREEVSVALMIFFALGVMFLLGYKLAYTQAVGYANEQLQDIIEDYEFQSDIQDFKPLDFGNIEIDIGVLNES
jgi:hypothetical protein